MSNQEKKSKDSHHTILHRQSAHDDEEILKNRGFFLGRKIDSGSFSTVRLAERRTNSSVRRMAVKIVTRSKAPKIFIEKFLPRELKILPLLNHCNIIQVYSIFHLKNKTYIFMELAPNGDLTTYVQDYGALPESLAKKWFIQITEAIIYCHDSNIAHRDLKCENILLDGHMNAKVADFGFARQCQYLPNQKILFSKTYCGSAAYVAPEIIAGRPYNPKLSDIWSLGVCLYVMVNNGMPFDDRNIKKMLSDQLNLRWNFRPKLNLSRNVKQLIEEILNPNCACRPSLKRIINHPWITEENFLTESIKK